MIMKDKQKKKKKNASSHSGIKVYEYSQRHRAFFFFFFYIFWYLFWLIFIELNHLKKVGNIGLVKKKTFVNKIFCQITVNPKLCYHVLQLDTNLYIFII